MKPGKHDGTGTDDLLIAVAKVLKTTPEAIIRTYFQDNSEAAKMAVNHWRSYGIAPPSLKPILLGMQKRGQKSTLQQTPTPRGPTPDRRRVVSSSISAMRFPDSARTRGVPVSVPTRIRPTNVREVVPVVHVVTSVSTNHIETNEARIEALREYARQQIREIEKESERGSSLEQEQAQAREAIEDVQARMVRAIANLEARLK